MKILLVEDNYDDYFYAKSLLDIAGIIHIWVQKGEKAVETCMADNDIRLVFMDIRLPGINGYEATERIKSLGRNITVIALTAYAMSNDRKTAMEHGCDDYMSKPYRNKDFYLMIDKWTGERLFESFARD